MKALNKTHYDKFKAFSGQGMSEMGIAIALIAVVGIVGLGFFSGVIQNGLMSQGEGLKGPDLSQLTASNLAPTLETGVDETAQQTQTPQAPAPHTAGQSSALGLSLGNGQYLDLGNYPTDMSHSIETAGANGTTNQLLSTMESIINQALAEKAITPEEANKLLGLAQQGHVIGDSVATVEAAATSRKNVSSLADLANQIGFNPENKMEGSQVSDFRRMLNSSKTSNAVVNQSIEILSNQIINIANGVEGGYYQVLHGELLPGESFAKALINGLNERDRELGVNTQKSLTDMGAGAVVHQNANAICDAGGGAGCNTP